MYRINYGKEKHILWKKNEEEKWLDNVSHVQARKGTWPLDCGIEIKIRQVNLKLEHIEQTCKIVNKQRIWRCDHEEGI